MKKHITIFFITLSIIAFPCLGALGAINFWSYHLTISYDKVDEEYFSIFKNHTLQEVNIIVDKNIDNFVNELFNTSNPIKRLNDKFISELWIKHFDTKILSVIVDRAQYLYDDVLSNHDNFSREVHNVIGWDGIDHSIRDHLYKQIRQIGFSISKDFIKQGLFNEAIAISAGLGTGILLSRVLKSGGVSFLVGFLVEEIIESTVHEQLSEALKENLRIKIKAAIQETLEDKNNGLYSNIGIALSDFHGYRRKQLVYSQINSILHLLSLQAERFKKSIVIQLTKLQHTISTLVDKGTLYAR